MKVFIVDDKLIEQECALEALLFAAGEPVGIDEIARALEMDIQTARLLAENLRLKYEQYQRGISIAVLEDALQMRTNQRYFTHITRALGEVRRSKLTPALLETLAIVAYKQPITKPQIEQIRGVSADHAVNKLMEAGLLQEAGRLDAPGKPILFATTDNFLKYLNIDSIANLPKLDCQ